MDPAIGESSGIRPPCIISLKHFNIHGDHSSVPHTLSGADFENVLLDWLLVTRAPPSLIGLDECQRCPLFDCRQRFGDATLAMEHVRSCLSISNLCYWCPSCNAWENLATAGVEEISRRAGDEPGHAYDLSSGPGAPVHQQAIIPQSGTLSAEFLYSIRQPETPLPVRLDEMIQQIGYRMDDSEHQEQVESRFDALPKRSDALREIGGQFSDSNGQETSGVSVSPSGLLAASTSSPQEYNHIEITIPGYMSKHHPPVPHRKVEGICDLINNLFEEISRQLPIIRPYFSDRSQSALFSLAAETLQQCIDKRLPSRLPNYLALILLGICAVKSQSNEGLYVWRDLQYEAQLWAPRCLDSQEAGICIQAVRTVWEFSSLPSPLTDYDKSYPSCGTRDAALGPGRANEDAAVWDLFEEGLIVRHCLRLVDEIEHTAISQRDKPLLSTVFWNPSQHQETSQWVENNIIAPLSQRRGLEPFRSNLRQLQKDISSGSLLNPRELEVVLLHRIRAYLKSGPILEETLSTVTSIFDVAMDDSRSRGWRNKYYLKFLLEAIVMAVEIFKFRPGNSSPLIRSLPGAPTATQSRLSYSLERPHFASQNQTRVEDLTQLNVPQPNAPDSSPFATTTTNSHISMTSMESLERLSNNWTKCPHGCNVPLNTKRPSDRKKNIKRHCRSVHGDGDHCRCDVPGCEKIYKRKDNLDRHKQNDHPDWQG